MATGIPARLTAREGRRFGLTVGIAFLALAGLTWWRGHLTARVVLAVIGLVLVVAGLAIPTRLGPVLRAWMGLAHAISRVTTPLFMGIVYFVIFLPAGVALRAVKGNPLVHREEGGGFWARHTARPGGERTMEQQF